MNPSTTPTSSDTVRRLFLAGTTVLAPVVLLLSAALAVDDPDTDGRAHLDAVAGDRDQLFTSNALAALGLAMLAIAASGVVLLARRRGGALATAGWILTTIGGISAASAVFLYGAVIHAVTDSRLERDAMGALDSQASNSGRIGIAFVVGFLGLALGLLLLAAGLWRARTVPLWMAGLLGLAAVLLVFSDTDETWQQVLLVSPLLVLVGLGVEIARGDRTIVLPGTPDDASTITDHDRADGHGHGRGLLHRSR